MIPRSFSNRTAALCLILSMGFAGRSLAAGTNDVWKAWNQLTELLGPWRIAEPKTPAAKAFRVLYDLHSNSSVLMERFGNPSMQTTLTAFHLDRDRLIATHYCAKGNQPRLLLKVERGDAGFTFHYMDATNLRSEEESRLVRLHLSLVGDELFRQEIYARNGKETESSLRLRRVE